MICLQGPVFFNEDGDRQGLVEVGQMQGQTLNQALLTEISNQCNTVKILEKITATQEEDTNTVNNML